MNLKGVIGNKMIEIKHVKTLADIQEQREYYIRELPFIQDLNAEENVWESQYYKIVINSVWAGYFCVDSRKTLWEFYLIKSMQAYSQEAFKYLIGNKYITAAECKTYDHLLTSLCLDFHKKAECCAYLFRDEEKVQFSLTTYGDISVRLAIKEDQNSLSIINHIEEGIDFFHNLEDEIQKGEVFVFSSGGELIGAGTCKKIWHGMDYYDIGMVVAEKHRKKGIGTFIIAKLKEYCYENGWIPVCGCYYFNYPSKRALEKAGFISRHRMVRFEF